MKEKKKSDIDLPDTEVFMNKWAKFPVSNKKADALFSNAFIIRFLFPPMLK